MRRLIITLVALVTMQSAFAVDRLSYLPCPILGGELSNSAATSVADIDEVMPRMKALGLNTVLVPAYWEFVEPTEGQFDFTLIDRTIDVARQEQLHVVFLWFGVWKNSMSWVVQAGYETVSSGDDCRGETNGDSLVLQQQCAAGRPQSLLGTDAAYP